MIHYLYLGRMDYAQALRLQEELVALRTQSRIGNVLLLLEHPPVLTLGRNANRSNMLASDELLAARGVTLHDINRGGDVTYHGPGQLIGYPIFDLRSLQIAKAAASARSTSCASWKSLSSAFAASLASRPARICGLTGVWCRLAGRQPIGPVLGCKGSAPPPGARKIAAIGIHVARGVTSHGFAFNVTTDLRDFNLIDPCGIASSPSPASRKKFPMRIACPSLESLPTGPRDNLPRSSTSQSSSRKPRRPARADASAAESTPEPQSPIIRPLPFPLKTRRSPCRPRLSACAVRNDRPISA